MRRLLFAAISVAAACGRSPAVVDAPPPLCTDQRPAAPTFTNVQLVFGSCRVCHIAGVELDLAPAVAYTDLVDVPAPSYTNPTTDESCGGLLVKPGDPAASYLYQKLSTTPCAGSRMPLNDIGITEPLPACEQALIHDWIAAGAPND